MSVRQKLSESESTSAFVIGGGLTLMIIAFALGAAQASTDPSTQVSVVSRLSIIFYIGLALFVFGVAFWLVVTRPWHQFDNWSKPLYTGHEHDSHETPLLESGQADSHHLLPPSGTAH